jgi:hypothetical protein
MMYKDSPQAAVDDVANFVQKKQDEIAKAKEEEEHKKAEAKEKDAGEKKDADNAEIKKEDDTKEQNSTETTREATRLAAAAILSLVQEGLKKNDLQDSAKIEVEELKTTRSSDAERKEDNLLVEVEH